MAGPVSGSNPRPTTWQRLRSGYQSGYQTATSYYQTATSYYHTARTTVGEYRALFGGLGDQPATANAPTRPAPGAAPLPQVQPAAGGQRRVFVLHSGMSDRDNQGARNIRNHLLGHGVRPEDIVILNNEYPHMVMTNEERAERVADYRRRGYSERTIPWMIQMEEYHNRADNFYIYNRMRRPDSAMAQQSYQNMRRQLQAAGIPNDAQLVGVAHSGGGQVMLTMDRLASQDRTTGGQHFHSIVTLGSPIGQNHAIPDTRVMSYDSPADEITRAVTADGLQRWTGISPGGLAPTARPPNMDANDRHIDVAGVRHRDWYRDPANTTRFLRDLGFLGS